MIVFTILSSFIRSVVIFVNVFYILPTWPLCCVFLLGISLHVDTLTDHSCSAESDGEKVNSRIGDAACESGSDTKDKCEDEDHDIENDERQRGLSPKPVTSSPLTEVEAPMLNHHHREDSRNNNKSCIDNRMSSVPQNQTVKPKLWSLAEIATSDHKQHLGQNCPSSAGLLNSTSTTSPAGAVYPASSILGRPIYYTSPFYSNYTNYGNFSPLQGQGILRYNSSGAAAAAVAAAANEGLTQSVLEASSMHKQQSNDSFIKSISNQIDQQFRPSNLESKKGT